MEKSDGTYAFIAILTIVREGRRVWIQRRNSTDGNNYEYIGALDRETKEITGKYIWEAANIEQ